MDNRIGRKFLHPGPGYGGSCFPKDTRALTTVADQFGVETRIVDAVIEANERQRDAMIPKIEKLVGDLSGKKLGVLGLSFKPETDDMRESPALDILQLLQRRGAELSYTDPYVPALKEGSLTLQSIDETAVDGIDCAVITTDHSAFRYAAMPDRFPLVVDTRNALKGHPAGNVFRL